MSEKVDRTWSLANGTRVDLNRPSNGTASDVQHCPQCRQTLMPGQDAGKIVVCPTDGQPYRVKGGWLHLGCAHAVFDEAVAELEAKLIEDSLAAEAFRTALHAWREKTQKDVLDLSELHQGAAIVFIRDDSLPRSRRYKFRILTDTEKKALQ